MTEFARLIRSWREDLGLSLSEAARQAGITKAHLWELEDGRASNPTVKTLAGIARAYGGSVSYMARLAADSLPTLSTRTEAPADAETEDYKRGYREGWNDREDDLIAGVGRIYPADHGEAPADAAPQARKSEGDGA